MTNEDAKRPIDRDMDKVSAGATARTPQAGPGADEQDQSPPQTPGDDVRVDDLDNASGAGVQPYGGTDGGSATSDG